MLYIFGLLFSILMVAGNTMYKYAVDNAKFEPTPQYLFSSKMIGFLVSWQFLLGLSFFAVASIISFWMLTKFQYSTIQAVTVPIFMALSYLVGAVIFKDHLTTLNLFGLGVLVIGVILASIK